MGGDLSYFRDFARLNANASRSAAVRFVKSNAADQVLHDAGALFTISNTDRAWAMKRSTVDKEANQSIRNAFLNSVLAETGLKLEELPKAVRSALNLGDYELDENNKCTSGKPLTVYRMNQVFKALDANKDKIEQIKAKKAGIPQAQVQAPAVKAPPVKVENAVLTQKLADFNRLKTTIQKSGDGRAIANLIWVDGALGKMRMAFLSALRNPDGIADYVEKFNDAEGELDKALQGKTVNIPLRSGSMPVASVLPKDHVASVREIAQAIRTEFNRVTQQ